jgi:DegV family protein with EDD domain
MSVRIICDSTTDLPEELRSRVVSVPLVVRFGDEEYLDGKTITREAFYEKLVESDTLPQTSQASPNAFTHAYEQVVSSGDEAVVLTLASTLSGTFESAVIAAESYDEIHVVDTESVAIGAGILAERALQLADEGLTAREVATRLEEEKQRVCIVALVNTLEYLRRGGRLSSAAAAVGAMLSIKPVISLVDGRIEILGKARGSKRGNNLLASEIAKAGGADFGMPILLGYTGLSDALLRKYIEDSRDLWAPHAAELRSTLISSVIGTHVGPDAIAVAFFRR